MATFFEVFEDTKAIFDTLIVETELDRKINIKILGNNDLKELGKVVKAQDWVRHETGNEVYIFLNEKVFEQLTDELKVIAAEEIIASISFNDETNKLSIDKPDITTYSLLLRKYGYPIYETLFESVKAVFAAIEEEKEQEKANKAGKNKNARA